MVAGATAVSGETHKCGSVQKRKAPPYLCDADEELAAVRPGPGVGHAQHAGAGVLEGEVLVLELGSVDRRPARAVSVLEVTTLAVQ